MSDTTKNNVASFPVTWEEYDTNNCGKSGGDGIVIVKTTKKLSTLNDGPIEYEENTDVFTESVQNIISMLKSGTIVFCPLYIENVTEGESAENSYTTYSFGPGIFNYYDGEHEWSLELQSGNKTIIIVRGQYT